jgi:hypothetical protein
MPNILINPRSGILEFSTGIAGSSAFDTNLSGLRMTYDNFGGVNLLSYNTNVSSGLDRFTIDGSNGRLFSVTDNLSGSLFSVNDIAGLPIIEAFDNDTVIMGAFNRNDFVLSGSSLGIGGVANTGTTKLYVGGNVSVIGNIFISGNQVLTGVNLSSYATTFNLFATGSTLDNKINSLSGYVNSQDILFSGQISSSGSNLYNSILSLSGLFTGYTGSLNATFATDAQLFTTGSILDNKINSLSGYVNSQDVIFSGQTFNTGSRLDNKINSLSGYINSQDIVFSGQIFDTGSRLNNKINSLSGYVDFSNNNTVFTTGNQLISGTKTFANNLEVQGTGIFNALDLSNISEFNFSGTNINLVNGNVNISGGTVYISGNPVLTGVNLNAYATTANLFATGSTLDNKINSLSGYVNSQDIVFSGQISNSGSKLDSKINSLSGYLNSQDILFSGQTFNTGSRLDNKINSLSGYVNSQDILFSGQTFNTGSRLDNKINSLSGYVDSKSVTLPTTIVYTTGDQIISGNKTFINNIAVSGTGNFNNVKVSNIDKLYISGVDVLVSNMDNLFLSGVDIVVTGNSSINIYNPIYISGNPVFTGIDLTNYTTKSLAIAYAIAL